MTGRGSRNVLTCAFAFALVASSPVARADTRSDARTHFDRAAGLFRAGRFSEARVEFQIAYTALPDPRVLANVAACYAAENRPAEALRAYREVLENDERPLAPAARRRVLAEVEALEARIAVSGAWSSQAGEGRRPEAAATQPPPPEPDTPIGRGPLLWTGIGVGSALALAGTVTGILALDSRRQVDDPNRSLDERRRLRDQTSTLALATDVLIDTAVVVGLATVVLYAVGGPSKPSSSDHEHARFAGGAPWPLRVAF